MTAAARVTARDEGFLEAFEEGRLEPGGFHHSDHVRAAFLLVQSAPLTQALERFTKALKRFAAKVGKPGLYHETITWAYLLLIHERIARSPAPESFAAFAAKNVDLLQWQPSILDRYYRPETLRLEAARRVFVFPDRLEGVP